MKFSLATSLLAVVGLFSSVATAQTDSGCSASYTVRLDANFTDDVAIKCTAEDMEAITGVIHAVVQLDVISSMLGSSVNEFTLAYEAFKDGVIMAEDGVVAPLDDAVIAAHETIEDKLEDIVLSSCADGSTNCLEDVETTDAETASEPVDDPEPTGRFSRGSFVQRQRRYGRFSSGHGRELEEFSGHKEGWTPIELGFLGEDDRRLAKMDCGLYGSCYATWCCQICNHCRRRRRLNEPADSTVEGVLTRSANGATMSDEEAKMIALFEDRVSKEIQKKLRVLARGGVQCLGNFWELEVEFERHFFEYI